MKFIDYKCSICGHIEDKTYRYNEKILETIECGNCKGESKRVFSANQSIVYLGSCGNASNGYQNTGGNIKKTK